MLSHSFIKYSNTNRYRGAMTGGMYSATPQSIISNYMKRDYDIGTRMASSWLLERQRRWYQCNVSCFCRCLCCGYVTSTLRKNSHASNAHNRYDTKPKPFVSQLQLSTGRNEIQTSRYNIGTTLVLSSSHDCCSWIFSSTNLTRFSRTVRSVQTILWYCRAWGEMSVSRSQHRLRRIDRDWKIRHGSGTRIEPKSSLDSWTIRSAIKMVVDTESTFCTSIFSIRPPLRTFDWTQHHTRIFKRETW